MINDQKAKLVNCVVDFVLWVLRCGGSALSRFLWMDGLESRPTTSLCCGWKRLAPKRTPTMMIARRLMLLFLAAAAAFWSRPLPAAERPAVERPNVVFILTDNQGAWTLGCYGNGDIRTPHADRLAAEGMRFTRAFSSNAVC